MSDIFYVACTFIKDLVHDEICTSLQQDIVSKGKKMTEIRAGEIEWEIAMFQFNFYYKIGNVSIQSLLQSMSRATF